MKNKGIGVAFKKILDALINTDNTRDIVFLVLMLTMCTIVMRDPKNFKLEFFDICKIALGFYFGSKLK